MSCFPPVVVPARAAKAATAANSAGSNACREKIMDNIIPTYYHSGTSSMHNVLLDWCVVCMLTLIAYQNILVMAASTINDMVEKHCCATGCS